MYYREFSQEDHLSLLGLIRRASTIAQTRNVNTENQSTAGKHA